MTTPIDNTGPPYPSTAEEPHVRPDGSIPAFDIWATVISQYANSPSLMGVVTGFADGIEQTYNIDDFYRLIINVDTAVGYGLDVWGRIVGVNRVLQVQIGEWFGFEEALPGDQTFGFGPLYSGDPLTDNFALSDQAYRLLIFAKAAANITDGSIPAINRILMNLFPGRGNCYVQEGSAIGEWFGFEESINAKGFNQAPFYSGTGIHTMMMSYVFEFPLTPVELAIVQQSGVLPKSTGVAATVIIL